MELSNEENHSKLQEREDLPDTRRRVRWSVELEEVRYYVPLPQNTESRWKRTKKQFKAKAMDLKQKPLILLWDFCDSSTVHLFQNGLECLVRKIHGRSESLDFEDIRDLNKPWDELFELYTARGEISLISQEDRSVTEQSGNISCPA